MFALLNGDQPDESLVPATYVVLALAAWGLVALMRRAWAATH